MATAQFVILPNGLYALRICGRLMPETYKKPDDALEFLRAYLYGAAL